MTPQLLKEFVPDVRSGPLQGPPPMIKFEPVNLDAVAPAPGQQPLLKFEPLDLNALAQKQAAPEPKPVTTGEIGGFFGPVERGFNRLFYNDTASLLENFGARETAKQLIKEGQEKDFARATGKYAQPMRSVINDPFGFLEDALDLKRMHQAVGENLPLMGAIIVTGLLAGGATLALTKNPVAATWAGRAGAGLLYGLLERGSFIKEANDYEEATGNRIDPFIKHSVGTVVGAFNAVLGMSGLESILKTVTIPGFKGRLLHTLLAGSVEGITEMSEELTQALGSGTYRNVPWRDTLIQMQEALYMGLTTGTGASVALAPFGGERKVTEVPPPEAPSVTAEEAMTAEGQAIAREQEQIKTLNEMSQPVNEAGKEAVAQVRKAAEAQVKIPFEAVPTETTIPALSPEALKYWSKASSEYKFKPLYKKFFGSPQELAEAWADADRAVANELTQRAVNEQSSFQNEMNLTPVQEALPAQLTVKPPKRRGRPEARTYDKVADELEARMDEVVKLGGDVRTDPVYQQLSAEADALLDAEFKRRIAAKVILDNKPEEQAVHDIVKARAAHMELSLLEQLNALDDEITANHTHLKEVDIHLKELNDADKLTTPIVHALDKLWAKAENGNLMTAELDRRLNEVSAHLVSQFRMLGEARQRIEAEQARVDVITPPKSAGRELSAYDKMVAEAEKQAGRKLTPVELEELATKLLAEEPAVEPVREAEPSAADIASIEEKLAKGELQVGEAQLDPVAQKAQELLGVTEDIDKAGFITLDGKMIDLSQGTNRKTLNHGAVKKAYAAAGIDPVGRARETFIAAGNVRVTFSEYSYGLVDLKNEPNVRQYARIKLLLEQAFARDQSVDIEMQSGERADVLEVMPDEDIKSIFNKIKMFYSGTRDTSLLNFLQEQAQSTQRAERPILTEAQQGPIVQRLKRLFPFLKFDGATLPLIASRNQQVFGANLDHTISWRANGARDDTIPHEATHDLMLILLANNDPVAFKGLELAGSMEQLVQWVGEEYAKRNAGELAHVSSRTLRLRQWLREFWSRVKEVFLSARLTQEDIRNILGEAFFKGNILERVGLNAADVTREDLYAADVSLGDLLSTINNQAEARYKSVPETLRTTVVNTKLKAFDAIDKMVNQGMPAIGEGFFNRLVKEGVNKEELSFIKFIAERESWQGKKLRGDELKSVLMNYLVPVRITHKLYIPEVLKQPIADVAYVNYTAPGTDKGNNITSTYREYRFEIPFNIGESHPQFTTPNMIGWARTDVTPDGVFRIQEVQAGDPIKGSIIEDRLAEPNTSYGGYARSLSNEEVESFMSSPASENIALLTFLQQLKPHINEFMIRAIIQRAAEDGHTKVRFAGPETIRRVEGHAPNPQAGLNRLRQHLVRAESYLNAIKQSPIKDELVLGDREARTHLQKAEYEVRILKEDIRHLEQIAEKGLPIQQLYSALGTYLERYKKGATRKVIDEFGNDWVEVSITPTDVGPVVQFQMERREALNDIANAQDPSLRSLDGIARQLGIPVDEVRKAQFQVSERKVMENNPGFKVTETLSNGKAIYDEVRPNDVSPFASHFGSPEYQALRKGFVRAADLIGKVIEQSLLHMFQHRQDVAGFDMFRHGKNKVERPEQLRKAVQMVYDHKAEQIGDFNLRLAAEGLVTYFKEIKDAYIKSRIEMLEYKTASRNKPWLVEALSRLQEGAEPTKLVEELGLKNKRDIKSLAALYKRLTDIRHWGIDKFITNIEPGRFAVVDFTGSIIAVSETHEGAVAKAREFLTKPGQLIEEVMDDKGNVSLVKNEFEELEVAISTDIRPPSPDKGRLNALKGRDNLLEVMDIYSARMRKAIALDPIYEQIKYEMDKYPEEFPQHVAGMIRDLMRDARGHYWRGDQILDAFLDKRLPKLSAMINKEGMAYTRAVTSVRGVTVNVKLGYRAIAPILNFLGGTFQHTLVKTGAVKLAQASSFIRSAEGKQLLKEEELYLGRGRIIEEMKYTYEKVQLWKPLGFFQAAEKLNVELGYAANYLMAREMKKADGSLFTEAESREFARRAIRFQQFVYNVAALPAILRSPTGRLVGQFKTYLVKEIEFISSLRGVEIPRYVGTMLLISGLRGVSYAVKTLPFIWLLGGLLDEGDKWLNSMPKEAGWFARTMLAFAQRGVPGALGGDITAPAVIQLPDRPEEWAGPFIGDVIALFGDVIKPAFQGEGYSLQDFGQLAKYRVPALNYYWQLADTYFGENKIFDQNGKPLYTASNWDRFLLTLGATPADKSREDAIVRLNANEEATRRERVIKAQNAFFAYVLKQRSVGDVISWLSSDSFNDVVADLVAAGAVGSLEANAQFRFLNRREQEIIRARVLKRPDVIQMWPSQQFLQ